MKLVVFIFLFLTGFKSHAQDTIKFISNDVKAVKVREVGLKEVKYSRSDNPDGPSYIVNKNDIKYIRYANGYTDTFKLKTPEAVNLQIQENANVINLYKIDVSRRTMYYGGSRLGLTDLKNLIDNYPLPDRKAQLQKDFKEMKSYKAKSEIFQGVAGVGFVIPAITSIYALNSAFATYSEDNLAGIFVGGIVVGAVARITGFTLSKINKNKRYKKMQDIALLYNQPR